MKIKFTSTEKTFVNDNGQSINYTERCIVFDNISYRIPKTAAQVFDLQFKDYINGDEIEVEGM